MRYARLLTIAVSVSVLAGCQSGSTGEMPWDDRHEAGLWRLQASGVQGASATLACYGGPGGELTLVNVGRSTDIPAKGMSCERATVQEEGEGWRVERQCTLGSERGVYRYQVTGDMARRVRVEGGAYDPESGRRLAGPHVQRIERVGECPDLLRPGEVLMSDPMRPDGPWRIMENDRAYRTVEELPEELRRHLR